MEWDPFIEYKNRNKMGFNMYKPNEAQIDILHYFSTIKESYNLCRLFYKGEDDVKGQLFILTHTMIKNKDNIELPLGYIHFEAQPNKFIDKYNNTYSSIFVLSRCSFGLWPQLKKQIKDISTLKKTRINIGETLDSFLVGMAGKYGREQGVHYVILFNIALDIAIESHTEHGWREEAEEPFKNITDISTGKTALDIFKKKEYIYPGDGSSMYKIIKIDWTIKMKDVV